jgi:hypothetical protein
MSGTSAAVYFRQLGPARRAEQIEKHFGNLPIHLDPQS